MLDPAASQRLKTFPWQPHAGNERPLEREVAHAFCGLKKVSSRIFRCQYNSMKEYSRQAILMTEKR
jgi:hypothetical protein